MAAGGVIPPQDYDFLYNAGVCEVFGPGLYFTVIRALMNEISVFPTELRTLANLSTLISSFVIPAVV